MKNAFILTILFLSSIASTAGATAQELTLNSFTIRYSYWSYRIGWKFEYQTNVGPSELSSLPGDMYFNFYNVDTKEYLFYSWHKTNKHLLAKGPLEFISGNPPKQIILGQKNMYLVFAVPDSVGAMEPKYSISIRYLCENFASTPNFKDLTNPGKAGCSVQAGDIPK